MNLSKLIEVLSRTIKDRRIISLIHKYLKARIVVKHQVEETEIGVPQGGNLSPIMSDIMLNELDKNWRPADINLYDTRMISSSSARVEGALRGHWITSYSLSNRSCFSSKSRDNGG
ncbi:reverse transcriptase domain-containing protein [Paenibacillus oryzisoli]|uniref:reverse transcriptase domain-containing protein n=1 Tax=Paenibacillus oryzisoli TaxID=1850517 RepID=UPI001959E808